MICYDFSQLATIDSVNELKKILNQYLPSNVGILVNNVGCSKCGRLDKQSVWDAMRQINININAQTYITYLMLPMLLERPSRSAIINISSKAVETLSGFIPIYSATKSYNLAMSLSLHDAYKNKIDVMAVTPHGVKSQIWPGHQSWTISAPTHGKAVID